MLIIDLSIGIDFCCQGDLKVKEIHSFSQDDLMTEDIFILDCRTDVFVWIGQNVDVKTKSQAFTVGEVSVLLFVPDHCFLWIANALDVGRVTAIRFEFTPKCFFLSHPGYLICTEFPMGPFCFLEETLTDVFLLSFEIRFLSF